MSQQKQSVKVEEILKLTKPTTQFLCPLSANTFGVEFLKFTIRDLEAKKTIFEVQREPSDPAEAEKQAELLAQLPPEMEMQVRCIRYNFNASFLDKTGVGAMLVFSVGPKPVPGFRMVERHYFREKLIKSFDFDFGFCIPNSTNTWEAIYEMPTLSAEEKADIIAHPFETRSDSFYFANGELIMHNKAEYAYNLKEGETVTHQHGSNSATSAAASTKVPATKAQAANNIAK